MAKKKACKNCGFITDVDTDTCSACGSNNFANTILGRMIILNAKQSKIAHIVEAQKQGEYAIKMR